MPKQYDLIVFDWDGTLADSTQIIVHSIITAAHEVGLPIPSQQSASSIIGLGLGEAILELFGEITQAQFNQVIARYGFHYKVQEEQISLFDGVQHSISALNQNGHQLAVATGKGRNGLNRALSNSGLGEYFHATRCVDECHSKPHPQMLIELMGELQVEPERTLMVGDTSFDLLMAKNAKVDSLGVTYGAHRLEGLLPCNPIAHFDNFKAVHEWIVQNA